VNQQANNGAAFYQVCYESPTAFKDRFNNTVNLGWLPDCKNVSNVPPCVQSITKDNAGNVLEKVLLPPGDPRLH
jgi:hypothetical protein